MSTNEVLAAQRRLQEQRRKLRIEPEKSIDSGIQELLLRHTETILKPPQPKGEEELNQIETRRIFGDVGFSPLFIVNTNLPHRDPGEIQAWTRSNGRARLTVQPLIEDTGRRNLRGEPIYKNYGIPYGPLPRLILTFVSTQVVITESPVIHLGDDYTAFLVELGLIPKWGRKGTNDRVRDQMVRLATCRFAYVEAPNRPRTIRNEALINELTEFWDVCLCQLDLAPL